MKQQSVGEVAFSLYVEAKDGKTYDGKIIPDWDNVAPGVQEAWEAAAQ